MSFFTPIPAGSVMLNGKGLYWEAPLYTYHEQLFAKKGRSFIRLYPDERTSLQHLFWSVMAPGLGKVKAHGPFLHWYSEPLLEAAE